MKKVNVYNRKGENIKEIELNPAIFNVETNNGLIHQVVETQLANARQVLAHTKTRGEIRGGGKKPWKQKGTGRARHGSNRSPIWVGGGITFGPRNNRNFGKKINKNMKKKALFMSLSDKLENDKLVLMDELKLEKTKTKELMGILRNLPVTEDKNKKIKIKGKDKKVDIKTKKVKELAKTLIVISEKQEDLFLSSRNLQKVEIIRADSLNVVDILKYKYLVMPLASVDVIEKTYLNK